MRYLLNDSFDIYNGPGSRVTLWVAGCPHHCKGCHNPHTWDPSQGEEYSEKLVEDILKELDQYFPKDLSILGGEPLAPYNIDDVVDLMKKVKERRPNTNIWLWTGYQIEDFQGHELFNYVDVIVDGPYIEELHIKNKYYGSSNQKIHYFHNGKKLSTVGEINSNI